MKTMKRWALWLVVAAASVIIPVHDAGAWDRGGGGGSHGNWSSGHGGRWSGGGGPHGHWGGSRGYWGGSRGYWGGPRGYYWGGGCWNCGAAGAAIVGLTLGTIVGSAIANSAPPPVVVEPPVPPLPGECSSIVVQGITYYNCGENRDYYDDGRYDNGAYQGQTDSDQVYNNQADSKGGWTGK